MTHADQTIYLASKSPRRRELLRQIGVSFELLLLRETAGREGTVSEDPLPGEAPDVYVSRIARLKAQAGREAMLARRLMKRSEEEAQTTPPGAGTDAPQTLGEALTRLRGLEAEVAGLEQRQAESAALLQQLAEQNARLVAAVEQLRQRGRLLLALCGVSSAAALAAFAWALLR